MDKYLNKRKHDNTIDECEIDNGDNVAGPSQSSKMESAENKIQNYLLDGKYYKIISVEGTKISASCKLCSKKIIAYNNSTGNLLSHYKLLHSSIMSQVKEYKILKMSGNSKKDILKQTKLFHSGPNSCSKQEVNDLVFEYIICEMRPLVTVEKRSFKKLILGLTHSNDESIIPNRKQILQLLKNSYNSYVSMLSDLIQKSKLICTTADIWSGNNKSYLGMTCHLIDPITYERKSFVLGCKRIIGSHTYLNITETMTCMTQKYNIHYSKISHTVTDNASNFAKVFRTFSTSVKSTQSTTLSVGDLNEDGSPFEDSDVETENITIGQIFTNSENQNIDESFCLPPHMRCCAHTLNLISTTDIKKIKDASYINISESTFKKLFNFWTLISRSTVALDKILEKCGCKFPIPVVTRWNSLYDSSLKVLKYKQQLTKKAFDDLHLIKLKLSEWTFLEEYCQVMEPLAISLDKLQGEKNSFLGYVAPTILVLRRLLISFTDLKYCKPLSFAIIQAIETRFNYILDLSRPESKDFIIAYISHPKFNTHRNMSLSPMLQLLIALRYYATGAFQAVLGDHICIHKSTVCRIVKKVSTCIATLKPQFIQMPRTELERQSVYKGFNQLRQFPNVIGAIDCTHIRIQSPNSNIGEKFRNRKGYFSINVQAVCKSNLQFINIVARWSGSVHDSTIFDNSLLRAQFENHDFEDALLLGDGGYACRNYLMTPLANPITEAEKRYQKAQIGTRNVIERIFGVWKRRFPVLTVGVRTQIPTTLLTIIATAVLHNMLIKANDPLPIDDTLLNENLLQQVPVYPVQQTGIIARRTLIETIFN